MKVKNLNKLFILFPLLIIFSSCSNLQNSVRGYMKQEKYSLIKGINAQDLGNREEALQHFLDAYNRNSSNVFTMKQLALIYSEIGEEEKAEEFYFKILEEEPNDGITLHNMGILYYKQRKYKKSLVYLNRVPKESITNEIIKLKVYNYYLLKDYFEAYNTSQEIIRIEEDINLFVIYAKILYETRQLSELHSFVTRLYASYPEEYDVLDIYSDHLLENLGETDKVIKLYKDYIIKYGVEKKSVLKISNILFEEKEYQEAKKYIGLILEEDMFDNNVLELKVKIYRQNGMDKEADRIENMLNYEKE